MGVVAVPLVENDKAAWGRGCWKWAGLTSHTHLPVPSLLYSSAT